MTANLSLIDPAMFQPSPFGAPSSGFVHPVLDSQRVFRTVLDCLARPARPAPLNCSVAAPHPLLATTAAVLLAMADFETSIWLDENLASASDVAAYLRFHTASKIVSEPDLAAFAVISDVASMPQLTAFSQGTPDYPDRSATLLLQVEHFDSSGYTFEGPGINGRIDFSTQPALPDFFGLLTENRRTFPCGVDLIFVTPTTVAALPRSVRLVKG